MGIAECVLLGLHYQNVYLVIIVTGTHKYNSARVEQVVISFKKSMQQSIAFRHVCPRTSNERSEGHEHVLAVKLFKSICRKKVMKS